MESMEFGQIIRQARKAIGMTQADLGAAMDRTRYWVIQLEKGERVDAVLADVLDVVLAVAAVVA